MRKFIWLILGIFFGLALSLVHASDYEKVYRLFTFTDFTLAGVIGVAVVTGVIGMFVLKLLGNKDIKGQVIKIDFMKLRPQHLIGGLIFGAGWALSGACPGTVVTQIGEGKLSAIFTLLGMLVGTWLYALWVEKHPSCRLDI